MSDPSDCSGQDTAIDIIGIVKCAHLISAMTFPLPGFEAKVSEANASDIGQRNGGAMLSVQASERSLLTYLLARLRSLDADVYVGHNFAAFELDVLLHRMQQLKVTSPCP